MTNRDALLLHELLRVYNAFPMPPDEFALHDQRTHGSSGF